MRKGLWEVLHNAPVNASVNAPVNYGLSDLQTQILKALKQDPSISYEELFVKLKKDRSTIRRNIQKLKSQGLLRRIGADKKGSWEIANTASKA